jgi:undecaprenyl-diphosphatase
MLEIIKAIIFGIIEGVTEWLPISSTGHMILMNEVFPLNQRPEFIDMFLVVIQLGAILAVVVMFWNQLFPFSLKERPIIKKDIFSMWLKIIVACIPAVIVELLWGDSFQALFYNYKTVAAMLIIVGVLFIVIENYNKNRKASITSINDITYLTAILIGLFQVIAGVFPGTSRSGATIIGALLLGVSRTAAAEFTFFLAVPVMFGASFVKLLSFGFSFVGQELLILIVGMVVAFLVSIIVIRFLMGYITKHNFVVFGWYRIVLGIAVLMYFLLVAQH